MSDDEMTIAIAVPGEWALQKTLGPVLTEIGEDLKRLYAKGRDKIIDKAYKKIENPEDGKSANLRIAHEALTSGSFSDEEICAEYFGGILASSRTLDGKNDDAINLLNTIKSLSSKQLHLHYVIYNSLNKLLAKGSKDLNVAQSEQIQRANIWFAEKELSTIGIKIDTDFNILLRQGLLHSYETNTQRIDDGHMFVYSAVTPTTYGVLLYAVAHNRLQDWQNFSSESFPDFDGVKLPVHYSFRLNELLESVGIQPVSG